MSHEGVRQGLLYWVEPDGALRRFDPTAPRDVTATGRVTSRPMGEAHRRTFWHRGGVRHRGPGEPTVLTWIVNRGESRYSITLDRVGVNPGTPGMLPTTVPVLWASTAEVEEPVLSALRGGGVGPAPGPSQEVMIQCDFVGDVTVESMSIWFHEGRDER